MVKHSVATAKGEAMIFTDPLSQKDWRPDGKWFAWRPVQIEGANKTAWLEYVIRKTNGGANSSRTSYHYFNPTKGEQVEE